MSEHSDPGDLALRALGWPATDPPFGPDAHLDGCQRCRTELDELRAVVAAVRRVGPGDHPVAPSPAVWDSIRTELGLTTTAPPPDELAGRRARHARRSTVAVASAAAAAGLVAGAVAGFWGAALADGNGRDAAVEASARLEPIAGGGGGGGGTVTVRGAEDGRVLDLDVTDLTATGGLHEVWLLADDGRRLVSLGLLEGRGARFPLPLSLDLGDFPVVDVSVEPSDGNPAHSGNSVLRGRLSG